MLPPVLAIAILIAGMSPLCSSGSSDAIAAVSIMLRGICTPVTGPYAALKSDSPVADLVLVIALALLLP